MYTKSWRKKNIYHCFFKRSKTRQATGIAVKPYSIVKNLFGKKKKKETSLVEKHSTQLCRMEVYITP